MRKTPTLRALLTAHIRSGYPGCLDIAAGTREQ